MPANLILPIGMSFFISYHLFNSVGGMFSFFILLSSYLISSLPCGMIVSGMTGYDYIRESTSKPYDTEGFFHAGYRKIALLVSTLDIAKGFLGLLFAYYVVEWAEMNMPPEYTSVSDNPIFIFVAFGLFVMPVFGHIYSIWYRFNGNRDILPIVGMIITPLLFRENLLLMSIPIILYLLLWIGVYKFSGSSSAGELSAMLSTPLVY